MRIAVIGATGLVGRLLADRLCAWSEPPEIHALLRRPSGRTAPEWHEHVAPGENWPAIVAGLRPELAISALGTTMRQAGSEAAFRIVDHDMVLAFARATAAAGASRMMTVSSVGADAGSSNFYLRLKGEVDRELATLGFARLDVFRPGLLRGPRGTDRRLGERIGILMSPIVNRLLPRRRDRFAAIDAATVAGAMAAVAGAREEGVFVHENKAIRRLAAR